MLTRLHFWAKLSSVRFIFLKWTEKVHECHTVHNIGNLFRAYDSGVIVFLNS